MKDVYFKDLNILGDLLLDRILFEYENIPILFTCTDKMNNYYLTFCSDFGEPSTWTITKVKIQTIIDLLKLKLTMNDSFFSDKNPIYIIESLNNTFTIHNEALSKDSLDLPEEGLYFREMHRVVDEYCEKLQSQLPEGYKELLITYSNTLKSNAALPNLEEYVKPLKIWKQRVSESLPNMDIYEKLLKDFTAKTIISHSVIDEYTELLKDWSVKIDIEFPKDEYFNKLIPNTMLRPEQNNESVEAITTKLHNEKETMSFAIAA